MLIKELAAVGAVKLHDNTDQHVAGLSFEGVRWCRTGWLHSRRCQHRTRPPWCYGVRPTSDSCRTHQTKVSNRRRWF
jgi:hypothetical protein